MLLLPVLAVLLGSSITAVPLGIKFRWFTLTVAGGIEVEVHLILVHLQLRHPMVPFASS